MGLSIRCLYSSPSRIFVDKQLRFHDASGADYVFLGGRDHDLRPDQSTTAARLVRPLCAWRRYHPARQALMRSQLERILAIPDLSKNTYEMVAKSLA